MTKWYYIAAAVFFIVMTGSIAVTEYQKGQCRIELGKTEKTAEEIIAICK